MNIEVELAKLKATFEERTERILGILEEAKEERQKMFQWLENLPCQEHKVRIETLEKRKNNNFFINSMRFFWGVIVLLWGAIVWLFTHIYKK